MKNQFIIFLLLFQVNLMRAQSKLAVGVDLSAQVTSISPAFNATNKNLYSNGIGIGLLKSLKEDKIQIKSGLHYQISKISFDNVPHLILQNGEVQNVGIKDQDEYRNYISLPIALNYSLFQREQFAFQIFGGTQLSYLYRTKYQASSTYNGDTKRVAHPNKLYPLMDAGLSLQIKAANKLQFFFKPKYTYSFEKIPYSDSKYYFGLNLETYYNF